MPGRSVSGANGPPSTKRPVFLATVLTPKGSNAPMMRWFGAFESSIIIGTQGANSTAAAALDRNSGRRLSGWVTNAQPNWAASTNTAV